MKYQSIDEVIRDLEKNPIAGDKPLYHPLPFSEFDHLKTSSDRTEVLRKWDIIHGFLTSIYGKELSELHVLDIGANAGFFTFNFAKKGAIVEVFEPHSRYSDIGEFLAREKKLHIIWHRSPFESSLLHYKKFDVSLMLSVFQWMAKGGKNMREARRNLHTTSEISDNLIFELGFNKGKACIKTQKFNHYAVLFELLQQNTVYNHFKLIGKTHLWKKGKRYIVACSKIKTLKDDVPVSLLRKIRI